VELDEGSAVTRPFLSGGPRVVKRAVTRSSAANKCQHVNDF